MRDAGQESRFHTATRLRELLGAAGMRPKRRFGQHFLIDRNLMTRLVESAELHAADTVLEVGTGTGSLTGLLAAAARRVHTFEIDPAMATIAAEQLAGHANVTLHRCDALLSQTVLSTDLRDVLDAAPGRVKLVANLPYDIATPLLMNLLLAEHPPKRMCFTIQREVGLRLTAAVGTRDYGPAAIVCRLFAKVERIASVPPAAFWPRPKVESVMLRMTPRRESDAHERRAVTDVVRRAFLHRRKTMGHILTGWVGKESAAELLAGAGIQTAARPEDVLPPQWAKLASRTTPPDKAADRERTRISEPRP